MGLPKSTKQRAPKGTVSITSYKKGLRLRWRYEDTRPALYISSAVSDYRRIAQVVKAIIERDILVDSYDTSLQRYKDLLEKAIIHNDTLEHQILPITASSNPTIKPSNAFDIIAEFNNYLAAKGKAEANLSSYYYDARQLLKRWGRFPIEQVSQLLNNERVSNKTFNDRRNCLYQFFAWCVRKKKLAENPLEDVRNKRRNRAVDQRMPFTDQEAAAIIEALRHDLHSNSTRYPHSQYWRFVAFLLHVGVRNGEAIGLRVKDVDLAHHEIRIAYSLSRTRKGSHAAARVLKGTKMENVRYIPMDAYLVDLLTPLCKNREPNAFVFVNRNGNPIDDKMFLRRVFRPLLQALNIEKRDLYACRHTFATRAVQQGMKPHEVAYIMGDSVETILSNYFHNNQKPPGLPKSVSD